LLLLLLLCRPWWRWLAALLLIGAVQRLCGMSVFGDGGSVRRRWRCAPRRVCMCGCVLWLWQQLRL
jgi:hypothetical protein